jgi:hypothetical protein
MIVGIIGLINSGKSTIANILVEDYGFIKVSFADTLKDAVAAIFGWPRELLQGDTEASRQWREQVDEYWSNVIGHPVTPRWVLQHIGTDVMREHFHKNIWVHSLMKKLSDANKNYVISDVRFRNEVDVILAQHGEIWEVQRPPMPDWYGEKFDDYDDLKRHMELYHPKVHASEWDWRLTKRNHIIRNNSTLEDLKTKVAAIISQ